jgi:hypothetical protein
MEGSRFRKDWQPKKWWNTFHTKQTPLAAMGKTSQECFSIEKEFN